MALYELNHGLKLSTHATANYMRREVRGAGFLDRHHLPCEWRIDLVPASVYALRALVRQTTAAETDSARVPSWVVLGHSNRSGVPHPSM